MQVELENELRVDGFKLFAGIVVSLYKKVNGELNWLHKKVKCKSYWNCERKYDLLLPTRCECECEGAENHVAPAKRCVNFGLDLWMGWKCCKKRLCYGKWINYFEFKLIGAAALEIRVEVERDAL